MRTIDDRINSLNLYQYLLRELHKFNPRSHTNPTETLNRLYESVLVCFGVCFLNMTCLKLGVLCLTQSALEDVHRIYTYKSSIINEKERL